MEILINDKLKKKIINLSENDIKFQDYLLEFYNNLSNNNKNAIYSYNNIKLFKDKNNKVYVHKIKNYRFLFTIDDLNMTIILVDVYKRNRFG
ncbi:mRNA-degrading endonuclease RelE of RelBE toxin-antitoxin system [Chryseomicrobium aureum]|uniref:hypothetical protein n=1 Tax=Chryseomicrobium aureum TaxID=1441723 RepID=UPI0019595790|nr:hypothetical protein [Chryseomicrobium aureum]MBM7706077.1 mRNA-degrading endonuclease RelE of RelBE toxin-antitoxin system [Chryseomicrobium aureum]